MDMTEQLTAFWPIILMVVIFYFLLWRPQKKQQKRRQEMLDSPTPGAKLGPAGGVMGTIVSLHDDYLVIREADKVEIRVTRAAVAQVLSSKGSESKKAAKKAEKPEVVEEKNDAKAEAAQAADENQKDAQ